MLNPIFAQPGWRPDGLASEYSCSATTKASGFTYLMSLVMSGRDAERPDRLARHAELETFLATPESVAECKRTNSEGWTPLMLAARNSRKDSSDEAVAMLLANESSREVARMQNKKGWTALMHSARNSGSDSTEETVAMLLAHESGPEVALIQESIHGYTTLMLASSSSDCGSTDETVAMLLKHESSALALLLRNKEGFSTLDVAAEFLECSTETTIDMLCAVADESTLDRFTKKSPQIASKCLFRLHTRMKERNTLSRALKEGLSLPGATALLYL